VRGCPQAERSLNASGSSPVAEGVFPWRCAVSNFLNAIRVRRPAGFADPTGVFPPMKRPRDRVVRSRPRLRFPPTRRKESKSTRKYVSVSRKHPTHWRRKRRDRCRPDRRNGSRRFRPPWPATNQPAPTGRPTAYAEDQPSPLDRKGESLTSD
jgi:hypothetical protein